jgi:hypothetical protein
MIFGLNKRKLNQEGFYVDKDQIEITLDEYLGVDYYSHGYFEPSSKRQRIVGMKALMDTSREKIVVGVTCWKRTTHLFKVLVLPTFMYVHEIWGGN